MKLSEAGLLGSSMIEEGTNYETCFIGAAVAAIGKHRRWHPENDTSIEAIALKEWPWLLGSGVDPIFNTERSYLGIIGELNGFNTRDGKWTRAQIAAYIATIEPPDLPIPVQAPADVREAVEA